MTLALVAFGLVMVYSSTSAPAALARTDPMSYLKKQGIYALIGVALMMTASRFDYRRLRLLAPALVLTALGGCLAVLVIGSRINGARRWIELGPATFQPSELAKLALAIWASAYLCKRPRRGRCASCGGRSGCCSALFCLLILAEPDLGTAISLVVVLLAVLPDLGDAGPDAGGRNGYRRRARSRSRSGSSPIDARASSASSIRGRTHRARASRPCRR